ncbi:loganic acid O-methyltransferase-like [Pistacia vera]|uniref:loganic acid O-methyltransferase-like n=1 Tax=Pistacia vera TaxID=55513 RepID=UPI001263842B|nr:loganic acid O-methyltransferase-like [Pistacia vera]
MEIEGKSEYSNLYSMYEGIGPWSYAENSYYQILADLLGQMHFLELKLGSGEGQSAAEFQVFFNDLVSNDFNTLFKLFPPKRRYYAAGVPGSFHDLKDKTAKAWNGGRIRYSSERREVLQAYSDQFAEDLERFLVARAQEVGLVSEEEVDSFNLPLYYPSMKELEAVIERINGHFITERMEILNNPYRNVNPKAKIEQSTKHPRAVFDGIVSKHFGRDSTSALFEKYYSKAVAECSLLFDREIQTLKVVVVLLKRRVIN